MAKTHSFKKGEEIANAITHGIGFLLSVAALVLLIVFSSLEGSAMHIVTFTIFGSTMMLLYINSTMVHSLPKGKAKYVFEILDHSSIYLFIAGTYTPITLVVVGGALGWTIFGIIWGIAIGGIVFKAFFVQKYLFTSTILYVLMGWLIVFAWDDIVATMAINGIYLLVAGGILYTVGAIFYMWRLFPYHHMIWHLFVIAGSVMHFFMVLWYVLPISM